MGHARRAAMLWAQVEAREWEAARRAEQNGQAIEGYHSRLYGRATYLVTRDSLADELQPRYGMESLLIDGMAEA